MKKAIAMKCTQEDWDSIKGRIPKERIGYLTPFDEEEYLANDLNNKEIIANIPKSKYNKNHYNFYETFNAKIFLEACGIEFEKKFEITKDQILKLSKYTSLANDWFPEVFKKELEAGKWYNAIYTNINYLFRVNKINDGYYEGYGFSNNINWNDGLSFRITYDYKFSEATPQEVETALIKECEKLGLVDGAHYTSPNRCFERVVKFPLRLFDDSIVDANNDVIFDEGIFATPIETITIQEAEKLLNKKIV